MAAPAANADPFLTEWPAFALGEGAITITPTALPEFAALPSFDIRNGDASEARSMLIKATIPVSYHWVPLAGSSPNNAIKDIEGYIRSHIDHLEENQPPNTTEAVRRKMGICLGVARAVATNLFSISAGDLIPGETAAPTLNVTRTAAGAVSYGAHPDLPAARRTKLLGDLLLTADEKAAIAALLMSTIGIIPLQGYSLMMTQHHYLSADSTQSRRAYSVVEKQFWKAPEVAAWFNADTSTIQDVLWHKSCHPVNMTLKTTAATSPKVAAMIREAGAGSAASRLPAVEPEVRAANSYRTLMATVSPMYKMCSGGVNYELLDVAIDVVKAFPVSVDNPQRPAGLDSRVPAVVINRATARNWLGSILTRNSDKAAHCYGFYCALTEASQVMGGGGAAESLRTSNSLSKLKNQSHAAFVAGQQFYSDYQSVRATLRAQGNLVAPILEVD